MGERFNLEKNNDLNYYGDAEESVEGEDINGYLSKSGTVELSTSKEEFKKSLERETKERKER